MQRAKADDISVFSIPSLLLITFFSLPLPSFSSVLKEMKMEKKKKILRGSCPSTEHDRG
jgi:hypothetical protein